MNIIRMQYASEMAMLARLSSLRPFRTTTYGGVRSFVLKWSISNDCNIPLLLHPSPCSRSLGLSQTHLK